MGQDTQLQAGMPKKGLYMRSYELVVLLHPDLEIDVDAPIGKIEKLVSANGGKLTMRDNWGKKRLAYPIKKQDFAVYVYFELDLPTEKVRDIEASLLITEEVLRHLLVSAVAPEVKAAKPAKAKAADAATTKEKGEDK